MTDDLWASVYAENEAIWLDDNSSFSDKQNGWRAQKVLLAHAARNLNEDIHYDVLKEHQDKLNNSSSTEMYIQERLVECQQLLAQSQRSSSKPSLEWHLPAVSDVQRACHGTYESCKHNEITINELLKSSAINNSSKLPETTTDNVSQLPHRLTAAATGTATPTATTSAGTSAFKGFRTAREQLIIQEAQKNNQIKAGGGSTTAAGGSTANCGIMNYRKKSLGGRGRGIHAKFVQPVAQNESATAVVAPLKEPVAATPDLATLPPSLVHLDAAMVEQILRESMHKYKPIPWEDIAGLEYAKATFMETIIHPLQRPDLFKGVRRPPRGVLLFGPPGTGKTLIAKCIASQAKATFFSINPSSLTSKWVGEGEKLVKTLFAVATAHQPAIIFMDEVDSLLSQRSDNEHESSRRLKNEFFIQLDGAATNEDDHIIIIGATNRPQELDEAVRRRFVRRLYVKLPDTTARKQIIEKLVKQVQHNLTEAQIQGLAELTEGYSGADMDSLCRYAAMQPLRALTSSQIDVIVAHQLPAVSMADFMSALQHVSKSVSPEDIKRYVEWNQIYGIQR